MKCVHFQIAATLFFSMAVVTQPAFAKSVKVTNKKTTEVCIKDLSVYNSTKPKKDTEVVVIDPDADDPVCIAAEDSKSFKKDTNGNTIGNWLTRKVSYKDTVAANFGGETIPIGQDLNLDLALFLDPNDSQNIFIGVLDESAVIPAEGLSFSVVNGTTAGLPNYFFSSTSFAYTDLGALDGDETPFTGTVESFGAVQVSVPEPCSFILTAVGAIVLSTYGRRGRNR